MLSPMSVDLLRDVITVGQAGRTDPLGELIRINAGAARGDRAVTLRLRAHAWSGAAGPPDHALSLGVETSSDGASWSPAGDEVELGNGDEASALLELDVGEELRLVWSLEAEDSTRFYWLTVVA